MKTKLIQKTVLLLLVITSISCKKGENDPFLSLRSRSSKITGEWKLTKMESSTVDFQNAFGNVTSSTNNTFTDTTWTENILRHSDTDTFEQSTSNYFYGLIMTLDKSNNSNITENRMWHNMVNSTTSQWNWLDANKNKSKLYIDTEGLYKFKNSTYEIDRLTNKELILNYNFTQKWVGPSGIYRSETTINEVWTFEKQ